jgi:predicted O-methyltransferase YrrM
MSEYNFHANWSKSAIKNTEFLFANNVHDTILEIGTFEGRYTLWLADNYSSNIHTIDPFKANLNQPSQEIFDKIEHNWLINLSKCKNKNKIFFYKDYSFNVLLKMIDTGIKFDFIYIDGCHSAFTVLEDLVLSFRLLKNNSIMLIDDAVNWRAKDPITKQIIEDPASNPKLAVDSFTQIYRGQISILDVPKNNQIAIRKL